MQSIEAVQVRLFDLNDGELVIDVFNQINGKSTQCTANLYRSGTVANDWSIIFFKPRANNIESKSPEAVFLAESLRQFGFVNHSLWLTVRIDKGERKDQFGVEKKTHDRKTPPVRRAHF